VVSNKVDSKPPTDPAYNRRGSGHPPAQIYHEYLTNVVEEDARIYDASILWSNETIIS